MKCQFCSNPATVHLTDIIHKKKREMHLCESCAREKKLIPDPPQELNIPALLQLVLGQLPIPVKVSPADLVCPECGTPYAAFRAQGRLGCPHDYEAFRSLLEPLLERVQSNAIRHAGKVPRRYARRMRVAQKAELAARLQAAVSAERYEEAAQIRDAIRALGAGHEP
ncbi:MAG TPA: UvrB/UvrC motif-containing protein [Gemmataceae bacterium]|nr:UvrB/UvrC motif-containing protein [Gemmataceae bacterium]